MSGSSLTCLSKRTIWQILRAQLFLVFCYPIVVLLRDFGYNSFVSIDDIILNVLWNLFAKVFYFSYSVSNVFSHKRAALHGALVAEVARLSQEILDFRLHADGVFVHSIVFNYIVVGLLGRYLFNLFNRRC